MERILFDSHTHINNEGYSNEDRQMLIDEIKESEVAFVMDIGFDLESSRLAVKHAKENDFCYCAVGVHPHDTESMTEEVYEEIKTLAKSSDRVKAIGEIGLDFHYDNSDREVQRIWFRRQLRLAKELELPVVIHSRDADGETLEILKDEGMFDEARLRTFTKSDHEGNIKRGAGVLLHCYSGSKELAREYVKLGATISIAGPVTFKNNKKTVAVVEEVSLDNLLIETDAPYLTPEPFRGRPNKAPYVRYTAEKVAEIKGISFEKVARATLRNGKWFFGIE